MGKILKEFVPKKPRPVMWDEIQESVKARSLSNEKRLSLELGFRLTPGSGNTGWVSKKGDGFTKELMVECKETLGNKISLSESILTKLYREAAHAGKDPVLVVSLYGLADPLPKDWVVLPAYLVRGVSDAE